jgi:glycosyltransferase involved in cell wall biosynthesis
MRIGLNALYLIPGGVGGTEIYLRELARELDGLGSGHEFVVFTNRETGPIGAHAVVLPVSGTFRPGRLLYEQFLLPGQLRRQRIDVLLNPGFTAPGWPGIPQATVFHDLQFKRHPEFFRWFDLPPWLLFMWLAVKRSDVMITSSEATRDDLSSYYGRASTVVHLGVEPRFFDLVARHEDGGYLFYASTTHPHKNHDRLMRVFAQLRRRHPEARLVLTGVRGFVSEHVEALIQTLGIADAVELKGWVEREELYELFRRARGFVYPSRFEGFGIPVVEALAAGLPVACSNIEPLRSIAGGCALLFDPDSDEQMLAALDQLWRGEAPSGGVERAGRFTWRHTAEATLRVLEELGRAGERRRTG